jgi:hypothetical protein
VLPARGGRGASCSRQCEGERGGRALARAPRLPARAPGREAARGAQVLGGKAPGERGDAELAPVLRLLAKVPFTAELAEGLQLRLARALLWVPLAPGCALFHEGDPGEHWYILVSGARAARSRFPRLCCKAAVPTRAHLPRC